MRDLAAVIASGYFSSWTPGKILNAEELASDALAVALEIVRQDEERIERELSAAAERIGAQASMAGAEPGA